MDSYPRHTHSLSLVNESTRVPLSCTSSHSVMWYQIVLGEEERLGHPTSTPPTLLPYFPSGGELGRQVKREAGRSLGQPSLECGAPAAYVTNTYNLVRKGGRNLVARTNH